MIDFTEKNSFQTLDKDNSGAIGFKEIKAAFQRMNYPITDQAIRDMIAVASTDGDDEVSFEGKAYFWCL